MRRVASTYERPVVAASMAPLLELAVVLRPYMGAVVLSVAGCPTSSYATTV
jgi:hypothetical protein